MTEPLPPRRRRRRTSAIQRVRRSLANGSNRVRATLLLLALAIAVAATAVAFGGGGAPADSPSTSLSPTLVPAPTGTLPAVATATPSNGVASASPQTAGIVARRIRITRLGINLRIVEGDGVDAPMNKAAHYPATGWPGGGTNIYIYAHAQEGMFLTLWDARVGDEVDLDLVDGTVRSYLVTQVKPKVPWNALQYLQPTPTEQLTLQTSTSYTPTAPRFIVIAEPAP